MKFLSRFVFIGLLLVFIGPVSLQASVADIEKAINTTATYSHESDSDLDCDDKGVRCGGYKTTVSVIDQNTRWVQKTFIPDDFNIWVSLYNEFRAFDTLEYFINEGKITPQGEVTASSIRVGNRLAQTGEWVHLSPLRVQLKGEYSTKDLFLVLKKEGVLSDQGRIADFEVGTDPKMIFGGTRARLDGVTFDFYSEVLGQEFREELYDLLVAQSTIVEVQTLESTRYEYESGRGFFLDLVGNLFQTAFFTPKDKVRTSKRTKKWVPSLDVSDFFPSFEFGFNRYPYDRGTYGRLLLNGQSRQNRVKISTLTGGDTLFHNFTYQGDRLQGFQINNDRHRHHHRVESGPSFFISELISYSTYLFSVDQFRDRDVEGREIDTLSMYLLGSGGGFASEYLLGEAQLGLSYLDGKLNQALGGHCSLAFQAFLARFLYLDFKWVYHTQPKYASQGNWTYMNRSVALNMQLKKVGLWGGYQWLNSGTTSIMSGMNLGVTYHFD
ncbi:MAG: hypothetical protein CL521_05390 [Actinobacteria bacterium]|nr:hypothetical protein [Actinomycetota bacterium]